VVISRRYARELVREGRAREVGVTRGDQDWERYVIVERLDLQRVDHYRGTLADERRADAYSYEEV